MNDTTRSAPAATAQSTAPLAGPSLIEQFGAIISSKLETSNKATNAILGRIEDNTSVLKKIKLSGSETRATTAKGSITRTAPLSRRERATPKGKASGPDAEKGPVTARRVSREEATAAAETAIPEKKVDAKPMEPKERGAKEGVQSQAKAAMPAETGRDKGGRFVGKSKSQEARAEQGDKSERRSILQSLKNGFEGIGGKGKSTLASNAGTLEEAAGRAAGGPFFEAAMEIKGAVDSARDEDGMIGKVTKLAMRKAGISPKEPATDAKIADIKDAYRSHYTQSELVAQGDVPSDGSDEIISAIMKGDKSDEKRHKELIEAMLKGDKGKTGESMGLPSIRKTGPGSTAKEKRRKAMKKGQSPVAQRMPKMPGGGGGGILSTLLSRFALPVMAVAGAGAAGYGAGTVINTGINKVGEAVTGKKDWTLGGQIYDLFHGGDAATTFETGGKKSAAQAAATISTGKGDKGGKSYGSYQLASKEGEVGKFLEKSGYASQFNGLQVGTKEFDEKWKQTAAQDPKFAEAQKQYAVETKYNPQMKKLSEAGIDLSGKGKAVQEMVLSTANQYGGNTSVIKKALKGKDVAAMSGADIISAVQDSKAASVETNFKSSSSEVRAGVSKRIQAEKAYLLAADQREKQGDPTKEATDAGPARGGDQIAKIDPATMPPAAEQAVTTATAIKTAPATKTPVKAMARKAEATAPIAKASGRAVLAEGELTAKEAQTAKVASAAAGQFIEPIATATATPVADIRKRVFRKTRARLAARGGAKSLEAKPVEGGAMSSPVAPMAEAVAVQGPSKVQQPERIQPSVDDQPRVAKVASAAAGASGDGAASAPGMDKLITMMTKMMSGKEVGGGVQQIRTEFDDTMLTLMAYDRV